MPQTTPASSLPQITIKCPLVSLSTAEAAFDCDRKGVQARIDDGTLRAFNIAGEIFYKTTLRIVASDIARAQRGEPKPTSDFATTIQELFPLAMPARPGVIATLPVATVARRLCVKSDRVFNLIACGFLELSPGAKARCGPGGSPPLVFESLVKFLRKRRV